MALFSKRTMSSEYEFMPDILPRWSRIQRVQAVITDSGNTINFRARRPIPRSFLLSKAHIEWTFNVLHLENAALQNFGSFDQQAIMTKEYSLLSQCTRQAKLVLNGYGFIYKQARYWGKYLGHMFSTNDEIRRLFSTSGGGFEQAVGAYGDNFLSRVNAGGLAGTSRTDPILDERLNQAWDQYGAAAQAPPANNATFTFRDYLDFGIFNPLYDVKDKLPDSCWYKHMSNLVPYVHQIEVELQLDNLAANSLLFPYAKRTNVGVGAVPVDLVDNGIVSAELVLTWVVAEGAIPRTIAIPSWSVDVREFDINNANPIADVFFANQTALFDTQIIHYHQTPTYLLLFASRDKDDPDYVCRAHIASDNSDGTVNVLVSDDENSYEPALRFPQLTVAVNVNNQLVNTDWTETELYNTTAANCRAIPISLGAWVGGSQQYANHAGQTFCLFRPDDLSIDTSPGIITRDFTVQLRGTVRTSTGFGKQGQNVSTLAYKLFVVSFYGQDLITLDRERRVEKRLRTQFV